MWVIGSKFPEVRSGFDPAGLIKALRPKTIIKGEVGFAVKV